MKSFAHSQCTCKTKFASMPRNSALRLAPVMFVVTVQASLRNCALASQTCHQRDQSGERSGSFKRRNRQPLCFHLSMILGPKRKTPIWIRLKNHSKDLVERTPQIGRPRLVRRSCRVGRSHCGAFHFLDLDAQRLKVASGEQCTGKRCKKCESWT